MLLPPWLDERWCRGRGERPRERDYVLYWMRTAVRGHENPALDAGLCVARELGVPLLVYHALSERYPFASDRHHTFILEGARDVAAELRERGIPYALHVEREEHRGAHLKTLGAGAAAVLTEEMPVSPLREWTERLATAIDTPVWTFDTACVVPMSLPGEPFTRAFRYRDAVKRWRKERLERPWEEQPSPGDATIPVALPFEPVSFDTHSVADLVAECRIDHSVAPVAHTRGGSQAGYARWERFKAKGLGAYRRTRNDPLADGASRMSAYLHYGHVSPFRLAREAAAAKAEKYVDELVTWRELAYTYCYYAPELDTVEALPAWARETLAAGERDSRPALFSWETLARAQTGAPLWDACQRSLLVHGELHNNVRMTWGKALLQWTPNVARALELTLDLNHRYALDGRDPSSYGGILWCFGQFDRPFTPAKPILGTVRPRPLDQHANRLDVRAFAAKTGRPLVHRPPRVAVVGAGIAGMMCARTLTDHGIPVAVFDKGRGAGGRMSTRRSDAGGFDHGAPYFVARDRNFRRYVTSWLEDGIVARWRGQAARFADGTVQVDARPKERFVGVPGMSTVVKHLARGLEVRFGAKVEGIVRDGARWSVLVGEERFDGFDAVLFGAPAAQVATLFGPLRERLERVRYRPVWSGLICASSELVDLEWDSLEVEHPVLAWLSHDRRKPGRRGTSTLVAYASPDWSREHLEDDPEQVAEIICEAVLEVSGIDRKRIASAEAHRWRYGLVSEPLGVGCVWDEEERVGVCGDGCLGPRIEDAFCSGVALAGRVMGWSRGS